MQEERRQYRNWDLPDEFWVDLLQVRNYLANDVAFAHFVYCIHNLDHPLVKAFRHLDVWLDRTLQVLHDEELQMLDH